MKKLLSVLLWCGMSLVACDGASDLSLPDVCLQLPKEEYETKLRSHQQTTFLEFAAIISKSKECALEEGDHRYPKRSKIEPSKKLVDMQPEQVASKRLACSECKESFVYEGALASHINLMHTKETDYPCSLCSKVFYHPKGIASHITKEHDMEPARRRKSADLPQHAGSESAMPVDFDEMFGLLDHKHNESAVPIRFNELVEKAAFSKSLKFTQSFRSDCVAGVPGWLRSSGHAHYSFDQITRLMGFDPRGFDQL